MSWQGTNWKYDPDISEIAIPIVVTFNFSLISFVEIVVSKKFLFLLLYSLINLYYSFL